MPARDEAALYDGWAHVPPRIACRQPFWAHVTLHHLRCGKLRHPTWLALKRAVAGVSGAVRVHHALKTGNAAEIDACTRSILLRVAGLRTVRGVRSLFSNAPFARAWWRVHTVRRIAEGCSAAEQEQLHAVLRTSQEYWERIVSMIVSRASVYGSVEVQAALITELAARAGKRADTSVLKAPSVDDTAPAESATSPPRSSWRLSSLRNWPRSSANRSPAWTHLTQSSSGPRFSRSSVEITTTPGVALDPDIAPTTPPTIFQSSVCSSITIGWCWGLLLRGRSSMASSLGRWNHFTVIPVPIRATTISPSDEFGVRFTAMTSLNDGRFGAGSSLASVDTQIRPVCQRALKCASIWTGRRPQHVGGA